MIKYTSTIIAMIKSFNIVESYFYCYTKQKNENTFIIYYIFIDNIIITIKNSAKSVVYNLLKLSKYPSKPIVVCNTW